MRRKYENGVNKISSIERVKTNVEKEVGDKIREYQFAGVKVDEDFRRFYPYGGLVPGYLDLPEEIIRESSDWK